MARLTTAPTPHAKEAEDRKAFFNERITDIRADKNLSQQGKTTLISELYTELTGHLKTLQAEEKAAREAKVDGLRRTLFGLSGSTDANTAISYRDAQDRAASLENEDAALTRLEQARLSNDDVLTQAIVAHAVSSRWTQVINTWAELNPTKAPKLEELYASTVDEKDVKHLMQMGWTYSTAAPAEVQNGAARW
jgi:hypothetical protein